MNLIHSSVTYIKVFLFIISIIYSTSYSKIKSPMIINDTYEFKIYEHPKCNMKLCSKVIGEDSDYCRNEVRKQSAKEKYGMTTDEAAVICMYTSSPTKIAIRLSQGSPGLYGCFMDHFLSGFLKVWNYNRFHNIPKVEILYTGINKERSRYHGLVDGEKCIFQKGDTITFPSFGSTSSKYKVARDFAYQHSRGGIIFNITTLKSKTKAVNVASVSSWSSEDEYLFLPGTKFKVISECVRHFDGIYILFNAGLKEIDEMEDMKEYETQTIDDKEEDILKEYSKICTQCDDITQKYCKYCNDNKCSECYAGYVPNENGKCVSCSNNCLKCNYNDLSKCIKCFNGYGLIENECKNCNDINCILCDGNINTCQKCKNGYVLIEGKCTKKDDSFDSWCKTYEYTISALKLWKKCIECIGPTYLENSKCVECKDENCSKCSKDKNGNEICSECMDGYGLVDGQCIKCSDNCLNCNKDGCLKCDNHFYLSDKNCKECSINCLECINNNETCTKCVSNQVLKDNKCESCSPCDNCYYENNNKVCTSCYNGAFLKDGKCINCMEGCAECVDQNTCKYCKTSYFFDKTKKCIKCDDGCNYCRYENDNKKCDFCNNYGYYMDDQGKCKSCEKDGCAECLYEDNKKTCIKCLNSYDSLSGEKCEKCVADNCDFCDIYDGKNICLYCKNDYNFLQLTSYGIKDGKCIECGTNECPICQNNHIIETLECKNNNSSKFLLNIFFIILIIFVEYYI